MAVGVTGRGTEKAGRRRADRPSGTRRAGAAGYALLLWLGVLVAAGAWFFLVRAAIDFGRMARDGRTGAWLFCGGAAIGASLCLLLGFTLVARLWGRRRSRVRIERPGRTARQSGGRHLR